MLYEALSKLVADIGYDLSSEAKQVFEYALDNVDAEIDCEEFAELLRQEVDEVFIYYDDAWSYLRDQSITDFDDAVACGIKDVCGIACYYLDDEVMQYLYEWWDHYDVVEDDDDVEEVQD